MEIFTNFFYQLLFTVGIIVIFGLLIAFSQRGFCRIVGRSGPKILLATGVVGTPIHELSHAIFCVLFGHKIEEIKLFQWGDKDGTLGYVSHSYNRRNIYQVIGNFFIGIGPIIGGSGVLLLLTYLLIPDTFWLVFSNLKAIENIQLSALNGEVFADYFAVLKQIVFNIFDFSNANNIRWWIFLVLALMVSSHMTLSPADIRGGVGGFFLMAGLLLVADCILYFVAYDYLEIVTAYMTSAGVYVLGFLTISIIFAALTLVLAFILKPLFRLFG